MNSKKSNEPFIEARAALNWLFLQAQGKPELLPRSYTAAPAAPAYKPVEGGDPDAIQAYARLVCQHVENLNSLVGSHKQFLMPVFRERFTWPILKSTHPHFSQNEKEIIPADELGKETGKHLASYCRYKSSGKIAWLVDELFWWADFCHQQHSLKFLVMQDIYSADLAGNQFLYHPLVAMLRTHLKPRESEVARLESLSKNSIAEWDKFMRALLEDCFNDRHCAEFLSDVFVTAKSRAQKKGRGYAKEYLARKICNRLKALAGVKGVIK
jgi:hypothetical protein